MRLPRTALTLGLFVCFLLPRPLSEGLEPSVVEETRQGVGQQPADQTATAVDDTSVQHSLKPNQGEPGRMRSPSETKR